MRAHNLKYRKRTMSTEKIIELYKEGKSTTELGKLANVSPRYIRMLLNDNDVERRAHGSWKRKYTVNEDYFKTWSNNMAYILGFFAADGMVARDAQLISFSQKEKYILEDIKKEMGSNHPIIKSEKSGIYILNLGSKILKNVLMKLHGILPNKAGSIKFPSVPKQYMSHFIRGYFDGDGYVKYEKYFMSIVGGSKSFMESLRDEIENNGFETNFTEHNTHFGFTKIKGYF